MANFTKAAERFVIIASLPAIPASLIGASLLNISTSPAPNNLGQEHRYLPELAACCLDATKHDAGPAETATNMMLSRSASAADALNRIGISEPRVFSSGG